MKKWLIFLLVAVLAVVAAGVYIYNKPHRDIAGATADFSVDASTLLQEFETDESAANKKYLDKIISVKGKVAATETTPNGTINLALETGSEMATVSCSMLPTETQKTEIIRVGDLVTVKGLCTGMLMDIVLTNCTLE